MWMLNYYKVLVMGYTGLWMKVKPLLANSEHNLMFTQLNYNTNTREGCPKNKYGFYECHYGW